MSPIDFDIRQDFLQIINNVKSDNKFENFLATANDPAISHGYNSKNYKYKIT